MDDKMAKPAEIPPSEGSHAHGFTRRLTLLMNQVESDGMDEDTGGEAESVSYEEFTEHWKTDPTCCWEAITQIYRNLKNRSDQRGEDLTLMNERVIELNEEADTLKDQKEAAILERDHLTAALNAANQERDDALKQLDQVRRERDEFALQIARGFGSVGSQTFPAGISSKSIKIPDPPLLGNGKDPRFEDWFLAIKQKLQANADHYNTPTLRIAYVASRTEGNARKHIAPRLRDDTPNPYKDATDMLVHLENVFADPNRERVAKQKYNTLYMRPSTKWHDFLSEFLYLAAEAGVVEETWKDDLYNKLTLRMQELTMPAYNDDTKSFREFTDYCNRTATNIENMERIRSRMNNAGGGTRSKGTATTGGTTTQAAKTNLTTTAAKGRTATPSLDEETRKRLMVEGKCFHCFKPGHIGPNCPEKRIEQLKVLEQPVPEEQGVSENDQA